MGNKGPEQYDSFGNKCLHDGYLKGLAYGEIKSEEMAKLREKYLDAVKSAVDDSSLNERTVSWTTDKGEEITVTFKPVPEGTADSLTVSPENKRGIIGKATVRTPCTDRNGAPGIKETEYTISKKHLYQSYSNVVERNKEDYGKVDAKDIRTKDALAVKKAIKAVEETKKPVEVTFKTKSGAMATFRIVPDINDGFQDGNNKVDFLYKEGTMSERRLTQDEALQILDRCANAKTKAEAAADLAVKADDLMKDPLVKTATHLAKEGYQTAKKSLTVTVGNR